MSEILLEQDTQELVLKANIIERDFVGAFVRATKGTKQIPGVEIYAEEILAAGRI